MVVAGEVREIDVWFAPKPQPTTGAQALDILDRMLTHCQNGGSSESDCLASPFFI